MGSYHILAALGYDGLVRASAHSGVYGGAGDPVSSKRPRRRKTDRMRRGKRPEVYTRRRGCWQSLVGFAWMAGITYLAVDSCCWMQRSHPVPGVRPHRRPHRH